jgi:hypothetical protein
MKTKERRPWRLRLRSEVRIRPCLLALPVVVALAGGFTLGGAGGGAGADTSLLGYNASALAIGSQYAFNVPGVVPLPNENLIEEDVPFSRVTVGAGPVVDSLAAPYYPGDIAASLGSLLAEFGAPNLPLNDPLLAESKYPTSPGYTGHASFGVAPSQATPAEPSIYSSTADTSSSGGDATGTISDLALDNVAAAAPVTSALGSLPGAGSGSSSGSGGSQSLLDIGNISSTNTVSLGNASITSTSTAQIKSIDIAGMVDISGLTSTASATSDGTTGTPTSSVHLAQVTVDGESAYVDNKGVHITATDTPPAGITAAQLQETMNATLAQDGISVQLLSPQNTSQGAQASANAGGLQISISHQFDVPFIPGEPTIPVPQLGNVGLPAGIYTATTSITFGLAQASVNASGVASGNSGNSGSASGTPTTSAGAASSLGAVGNTGVTGNTGAFGTGAVDSLGATGDSGSGGGGSAGSTAVPLTSTSFPIRGIPAPIGWMVTALLACILAAYPLLLLARWQFSDRRRT